jgi:hypothetical protein
MNTRLAVFAILFLFSAASCHKRVCEDELGSPMVANNTWNYGTTSYSAANWGWTKPVNGATLSFYAAGTGAEMPSMNFRFWNKPKESGIYRIVAEADAADEVSVYAKEPIETTYAGTDDAGFVTVTFKEGRMSVYCSKVSLSEVGGNASRDYSFNLSEF